MPWFDFEILCDAHLIIFDYFFYGMRGRLRVGAFDDLFAGIGYPINSSACYWTFDEFEMISLRIFSGIFSKSDKTRRHRKYGKTFIESVLTACTGMNLGQHLLSDKIDLKTWFNILNQGRIAILHGRTEMKSSMNPAEVDTISLNKKRKLFFFLSN